MHGQREFAGSSETERRTGHDTVTARWRRLTTEATDALAAGDLARARVRYEDALAEAEGVFATAMLAPSVDACVGPLLFNIATQNLADLARRVGDDALASELVSEAFERLVTCAASESAPLALRLSCARNLNPALAELLADLAARDLPSRAASSVARARAAALSVLEHVQ